MIGLLDLYGPTIYTRAEKLAKERLDVAGNITKKKWPGKFRLFFAVHELRHGCSATGRCPPGL